MAQIYKEGREQHIKENTPEAIIRHELQNYESFYTMDFTDAINALKPYNFPPELIQSVINKEKQEYFKQEAY